MKCFISKRFFSDAADPYYSEFSDRPADDHRKRDANFRCWPTTGKSRGRLEEGTQSVVAGPRFSKRAFQSRASGNPETKSGRFSEGLCLWESRMISSQITAYSLGRRMAA